ncbi:hypothetical protein EJA72_28505 [Pseudomonas sp. PB120]|nr:hypothetical protein [Pseudomonas sp. PB120]
MGSDSFIVWQRLMLLWRGSLLPFGCVAVAKPTDGICLTECSAFIGTASRSSGSKLPRHRVLRAAMFVRHSAPGEKLKTARTGT